MSPAETAALVTVVSTMIRDEEAFDKRVIMELVLCM
jgi:hypothetical protein